MGWLSALGTFLLATTLTGLPLVPNPDAGETATHPIAELVPEVVENATLSTELQPPLMDPDGSATRRGVVYLINLYAVTNSSDSDEKLSNEIVESAPGILEPIATVLLIVNADDEEIPVGLDGIAENLEGEGFVVSKVVKDGETRVVKVNFGNVADDVPKEDLGMALIKPLQANSPKVRRKRAPCMKCNVGKMMSGGSGGCGGGCGGGQQQTVSLGIIPILVVPVQVESGGGGQCCQGGGGGGGGSWSQSMAVASVQLVSGGW